MNFDMSMNPESAAAVARSIISDGNDIANKIESVINKNPNAEAYGFPAANVHKIVSALRLNAMLAEKAIEEGAFLQAKLMELAKKHNITFE